MLEVLVLEDQPAVREVISEVISDLEVSMHIGEAGSLSEARQMLSNQKWDGLVADLSLGDGQSLELVSELRAHNNHLPVILVSGFLTQERLEEAEALDVEHVLAKPFDSSVLLECIRDTLVPNGSHKAGGHQAYEQCKNPRILSEMFEMDRRLGLLSRMFDEMPRQHDISSMCGAALNLAMEMIHAQGGFLALFERQCDKMVMVAEHGLEGDFEKQSDLSATPFQPLIHGQSECVEVLPYDVAPACWPGIDASHYVAIPVLLQGVHMGVLCLLESERGGALKVDERHLLSLLVKKLDTLLDNRAVHAALADSMNETLIALVRSLEARDRYTKDHSSRVGKLSMLFAEMLHLDEESIQVIRTGGLLHDIGKVGIPDSVLLKPGRYTDQEFAIMKAHPAIGDSILKNMDTLVRERLMVRHHHERFDGKGYPDKLAGEDIPFEARIVCVADAIDAMTTHRVYRMARPLSFCLEQLKGNSGTQFDAQVVDVAISAIEQGLVQTQAQPEPSAKDVLIPLSATS